MSVKENEAAISELAPAELAKFSEWFEEFQAEAWDRQLENDVAAGKLEKLAEQANTDFEAGRCRPL